ncbi:MULTISPECIES: thioredoxin family protein [Staphylococcus]|uniref:thioredoxin family protein n=1 Tax=Staphylococcus TaxID=1279 RepID=UPI0021D26AF9|nr:thioredoxin family protein [Staphylococcus sp. IVB6181]UXV34175.1 thioredoxin family protein [Staphylococcus sp. IVB6181]
METLKQYSDIVHHIENEDKFLLYVMAKGCSVCHADQPRVDALVNEIDVPGAQIIVNDIPEAAGQLSLFTSPVVILFNRGREFHRQARIIDFDQLKRSMEQLKMA